MNSKSRNILNTQMTAQYLGLSCRTLEKWRTTGEGPTFRKLGGAVRYLQSDLENFVKESIRETTGDSRNVDPENRKALTNILGTKLGCIGENQDKETKDDNNSSKE